MKQLPETDQQWYYSHMRNNAWYLAKRIEQMVEAMDSGDTEYQDFFRNHFRAVLPDFWKSIGREQ